MIDVNKSNGNIRNLKKVEIRYRGYLSFNSFHI